MSDKFITEVKGYTNTWENSIRRLVDILFGPQDFEDFILLIISKIPVGVHGLRNILLLFGLPKNEEKCFGDFGIFASTVDPIFTKNR